MISYKGSMAEETIISRYFQNIAAVRLQGKIRDANQVVSTALTKCYASSSNDGHLCQVKPEVTVCGGGTCTAYTMP